MPVKAASDSIPAELRFLAERVLSEARRILEQTGTVDVVVMIERQDGKIVSLPLPPEINQVMDSGAGKDFFFGLTRKLARAVNAKAVLVATDTWMGVPTEKQIEILRDEGQDKITAMFKGKSFDEVEAIGLVERREAIVVTVQTAERVLIVHQFYERNGLTKRIDFTGRDEMLCSQEDFDGRQKMFGSRNHGTQ